MSTNTAPSRRVTNSPAARPSAADVAKARFEEAKAITDALVIRLSRERSEHRGAVAEERIRVSRRVEATKILLTEARSHERRCFELLEHERLVARGASVVGVRSDQRGRRDLRSVKVISRASERHTNTVVRVASTGGRRSA